MHCYKKRVIEFPPVGGEYSTPSCSTNWEHYDSEWTAETTGISWTSENHQAQQGIIL